MSTRSRFPAVLSSPTQNLSIGAVLSTIVAVLSLLSLVWAGYWMVRAPYSGFDLTAGPPASITMVDPESPAANLIQVGDLLLQIDGKLPLYARDVSSLNYNDVRTLVLQNAQGVQVTVRIPLASPFSLNVFIDRFVPLFVSLVFWLSGLLVYALFARSGADTLTASLYFAFCQLIVVYIASVQAVGVLSLLVIRVSLVFGAWLAAVALHLHVRFPRSLLGMPVIRVGVVISYAVALVVSILVLSVLDDPALLPVIDFVDYWLLLTLLGIIIFMAMALIDKNNRESIFRARVVLVSTMAGLLPAMFLTMLPALLMLPEYSISPSRTFVFMGIVPVGYAYAILRYRLLHYDGAVSRAIGSVIAIFLLIGLLATVIVTLLISRIVPPGPTFVVWVLALTVVAAVIFEPARRRIQDTVDRVFERPWAEFRSTLVSVDETLASEPAVTTWAGAVCRQFAATLDVAPVGLLYRPSSDDSFQLAIYDPAGVAAGLKPLKGDGVLIAHIASLARPLRRRDLQAMPEAANASSAEAAWLASDAIDLWWPIQTHGQLSSVLLLGARDRAFSNQEIELLALASHQIGAALENAEYVRELEELSRATLKTREDERRRVSHDLHDHIIQPLVGLNFTLATVRDVPQAAEAREQISDLITHVRRISADLRPPALDEVGLGAAVHGLTRTFTRATGLQVDLAILPDEEIDVPEPIASTIYSALREALNNIQKYAQATRVSVLVEVGAGQVLLVAHDDGIGFSLPDRLGKLATSGHFGLLGLQERLTAINGSLEVHTSPGQGTRLECRAPLPGR